MTFKKVNPKQSFPELEKEILNFWDEEKIFEESVENRNDAEEFNFYDGPPFATGTPHYGHILAGTIKDVVPRYQTMKGKKVERRFGWDTHGLPIENIVEKKLEISGKEQIEEVGVHKFNEICRENVLTYVDEWKKSVRRMGRWVDMENDYKTMDVTFMESVWWVYKQLYDKGLIYEGNKVVPYCPRCTTPLSNFEVNQGYKDKQDKSITVKFKLRTDGFQKAVGIIVRNEDGKILLGKRTTNGLLTKPGGMVDSGETALEAAIRELEEETGIYAENLELFSTKYNIDPKRGIEVKNYLYIVNVKNDVKIINNESDKFEFWDFYDVNEVKDDEIESYQIIDLEHLRGTKEIEKVNEPNEKFILAWTTTPWTLMSNLGLAVGEDIDYSEIKDLKSGEIYILASEKIKDYYKSENEYELLKEYKGTRLEGMRYEPIFPDFSQLLNSPLQIGEGLGVRFNSLRLGENAYTVVLGHHVDTTTGTGIVHIAPAYGEDDFIIGEKNDLGFVQHIDGCGKTINTLKDNGKYVFDFNEEVISELKSNGVLVKISTIDHSYPHCWRCNTPLIYRGIGAWYVAVKKIREQLVANNQKVNWIPETIKNGRMGNWLENAIDWNISRNRYWGSAIPVWQSQDKKQEVCVGSIEELYELNKDFGQITKIIWVRHGRTDYNEKRLFDFEGKAKLNEIGKNQAQQIKEIFKNEKIDAIFSSPLQRCLDTISPLANEKKLEIITNDALRDIYAPEVQDKTLDCKNFKWENGYGGGEKIVEVYERVEKFLKQILEENKGKTIVICSHGDPTFLGRKVYKEVDYDTEKYTSGIYLENNPEKYDINRMYAIDYVYTDNEKEVDIHKHYVDEIKLKHPETGETLTRVPEVLDCWFESGSMPYAQKHYPFAFKDSETSSEGQSGFKFPADFIAEGLDQTRGWFYTLLILGTALFDNTPFLNCIVNGIVLAEDGKKMSKSLQNYPDPDLIFEKYGADAMRFYLMNSPVVEAQDFRFCEGGVEEVIKKVILPLWNTYYFFTTYANIDGFTSQEIPLSPTLSPQGRKGAGAPSLPWGENGERDGEDWVRSNNLDKWIISELNELIKNVSTGFDNYKLDEAAKPIPKFMDNLTNWYIRRSRKRFWKSENDNDKLEAYETLYFILVETCKVIAPFMPFVSEHIFKELTGKKSVHLEDYPKYNPKLIDEKLNKDTDTVQKIITLGLAWRANNKIRVRQPLNSITITEKLDEYYKEILKEELNVKEVIVVSGEKLAKKIVKPNGRTIGPKFGKDVKFIMENAKSGNFEELENGNVIIHAPKENNVILNSIQDHQNINQSLSFELTPEDFEIEYQATDDNSKIESSFGMVIAMDDTITEELKLEGYARDIVRHIQEARKEADYQVDDRIEISISGAENVLNSFKKYIENETLSTIINSLQNPDLQKTLEIEDLRVEISLKR